MTETSRSQINDKMEDFRAPKDPVAKRDSFFVMFEKVIEATPRHEGKPSQEIYLDEGRLKSIAKLVGGVTDEAILTLLDNCKGFHKLVHSIGVSIKTTGEYVGDVHFVLHHYGKENKYETGTLLRVPCPTDGTETLLELGDHQWSVDDEVPGKFAFEFEQPGELATAIIKFYVHDSYKVPEMAMEPPVAFDSRIYKEMIRKSLLSKGNNHRLKAAIEKAERGDDVTIAYIGGSITQGAGAKPIHTHCYAYQSYLKFRDLFEKKDGENVHFVKAGVGGTPSELGMIRYDRDILRNGQVKPDIVIVEFAVNDAGDETQGICYESLCLKILASENKPAVILLFSVFENDWNLQNRLSPIGKHYDLPMVSIKDAVVEQFRLTKEEGNVITKRQFFYDIYHPTNDGHRIMADCLQYLFSETKKSIRDREDIKLDQPPVIGHDFKDVQLLDRKENRIGAAIRMGSFSETDDDLQKVEMDVNPFATPQFPNNWMHSASSGNESFKMSIYSRNLLLVFKDSGSRHFGSAEIWVDGKHLKNADPHEVNWTHCNAVILYQEDVCREHQVEIKMAPQNEDKCFTILGFGYTL
ncbi:SGNH/GDSL hydrolase family protein [Pullulanibacillus sp. KACC 23026]|uniref:SGNH/GDSL hydrolase family protein n=1 Tax=Pullulanibacillus sp. KACC 23026 TaxID=3028315 RepID=UPI0023B10FF3|nr:SGNH/GDSL hydrolase family protein [Pullulanibacillus sp. KACC 23026]WEG11098.1 SGNH/GDSL hydrolase family protein [Pullulanibacillus sp. KACC 23026]